MGNRITIQDIRNLLARSKNATSFRSKLSLEEVASNFRELVEMFESLFSMVEKLEEAQRKNKEYEEELKKLRKDTDRVKLGLHNVAKSVKNGK